MKVTFLGHGLNSENQNNVGKQLAISFESKYFQNFYGFVAFAAVSGIDTILSKIKKASSKYDNIRFYIGVDNKGTSKEALEKLIKENIETYIYHRKEKYITYHPKLFIFEGEKFSRVLIGSSNLTNSGFKSNVEASIQLDFRTMTDKQGNKLLTEIKDYYKDLFNLSDKNLFKLDIDLLKKLENQDLLYSQFTPNGGAEETQPTDGENDDNETLSTEIPVFNIDGGFEPDDKETRDRAVKFSATDYENFESLFEKYKIYKKEVRSSGVVNKDTEDRELYRWYRRIKDLIRNDELPDDLLQRLVDADFPIGDGWEKTRLMIWDKKFKELLAYKEKVTPNSKKTHVPQFKNNTNPYYQLGTWCATQKQRRKGNYTPVWTEYEEKKMKSINFLWEVPNNGSRPKDEEWADNLVELEQYYSDPKNYESIPHQNTKIGKWLNEQITMKLTGSRGKVKTFLSPIREEMLGELLARNGVEWEWQKQKERKSIETTIDLWKELAEWEKLPTSTKLTEKEKKRNTYIRQQIAQTRHRSKGWKNDKHKWKIELLIKVGFPLSKDND